MSELPVCMSIEGDNSTSEALPDKEIGSTVKPREGKLWCPEMQRTRNCRRCDMRTRSMSASV